MAKTKSASFVVTLKLKTQPFQEDVLAKRLDLSRKIYNACLGEGVRRHNKLRKNNEFQALLKQEKTKERNQSLEEVRSEYGVTEHSLHHFVRPMHHVFQDNIDSFTAQKLATRAYLTLERLMYGEAKKVFFKRYGEMSSVEGKSNKTGIRYRDGFLYWGKHKKNPLSIPVEIKKKDIYAQQALTQKIKYVRILKKHIRGKIVYFAQLIIKGLPPRKLDKDTGCFKHKRGKGKVGIDIGTQTIAFSSCKDVKLLELAPSVTNIEKTKRVLQRKLDRQRRANNPDKYNDDGTIKRDNGRSWVFSKNYKKTRDQLQEIQRKIAEKRRQDHNKLANSILSLGDECYVETMNYKGLQARGKKTTINENTGRMNRKKRFGKSLANKAPSLFLTILDNKLEYDSKKVKKVDTTSFKASQFNHFNNTYRKKNLSERWNEFDCGRVQRDLYSSFLLMNADEDLKQANVESCHNSWDVFFQLHNIEIERLKNQDNLASMGIG
ncbi:hypothetical protein [Shouchella shacheensis]|uniref:hypothetical protein n=1 Tax=Shouchella shacheensis TaxID=1649580 RepID=UPI00073FDD3E|nr:hypothetical protein [Shouchella shacheensis]